MTTNQQPLPSNIFAQQQPYYNPSSGASDDPQQVHYQAELYIPIVQDKDIPVTHYRVDRREQSQDRRIAIVLFLLGWIGCIIPLFFLCWPLAYYLSRTSSSNLARNLGTMSCCLAVISLMMIVTGIILGISLPIAFHGRYAQKL